MLSYLSSSFSFFPASNDRLRCIILLCKQNPFVQARTPPLTQTPFPRPKVPVDASPLVGYCALFPFLRYPVDFSALTVFFLRICQRFQYGSLLWPCFQKRSFARHFTSTVVVTFVCPVSIFSALSSSLSIPLSLPKSSLFFADPAPKLGKRLLSSYFFRQKSSFFLRRLSFHLLIKTASEPILTFRGLLTKFTLLTLS